VSPVRFRLFPPLRQTDPGCREAAIHGNPQDDPDAALREAVRAFNEHVAQRATWAATTAFYERLAQRSRKLPHEPNVLARARRRHQLAVEVLGTMGEVLANLRVVSVVKVGNDETKAVSDKPHGSSHLLSLVPAKEHGFRTYGPRSH
jgi:hypothetical protein